MLLVAVELTEVKSALTAAKMSSNFEFKMSLLGEIRKLAIRGGGRNVRCSLTVGTI